MREVALPAIGTAFRRRAGRRRGLLHVRDVQLPVPRSHSYSVPDGTDSIWFKLDVPGRLRPRTPSSKSSSTRRTGRASRCSSSAGSRRPRDGRRRRSSRATAASTPPRRRASGSRSSPGWSAEGSTRVANLRGGGEYGEAWHRAGMRHQKHHVFEDFEAAAEALVKRSSRAPTRLVDPGRVERRAPGRRGS